MRLPQPLNQRRDTRPIIAEPLATRGGGPEPRRSRSALLTSTPAKCWQISEGVLPCIRVINPPPSVQTAAERLLGPSCEGPQRPRLRKIQTNRVGPAAIHPAHPKTNGSQGTHNMQGCAFTAHYPSAGWVIPHTTQRPHNCQTFSRSTAGHSRPARLALRL